MRHTILPKDSARDDAILIAAISGRALAASARRGGYIPRVADFFGDQDTTEATQANIRFTGALAEGIREDDLIDAMECLAERSAPCGVVYGAGFEDRPHLLANIAQRWPLFGNSCATINAVKDPEIFSGFCRRRHIPHPRISIVPPSSYEGWLAKRRGGSGGIHIANASTQTVGQSIYYQSHVSGTGVSALLLADGEHAVVLGLSEQWTSPTLRKPYRYGGAARPAQIAPRVAERLATVAHQVAVGMSLKGLNSADFLVDGDDFNLLEINPRPGATLDIFEPEGGSLFSLHVAACKGRLIANAPRLNGSMATAIAYAEHDFIAPAQFVWPVWTADRPRAGVEIRTDDPICTVHASAATTLDAKALVSRRVTWVQTWAHATTI